MFGTAGLLLAGLLGTLVLEWGNPHTLGPYSAADKLLGLLVITEHPLDKVLFEAVSAFATVGLSTGITGDLPGLGQAILVVLMFVGRVGTITVASALALRASQRRYRYPAGAAHRWLNSAPRGRPWTGAGVSVQVAGVVALLVAPGRGVARRWGSPSPVVGRTARLPTVPGQSGVTAGQGVTRVAGTGARIDPDVDLRPAERREPRPRMWPVLVAISAGGVAGAIGRQLIEEVVAGRAGGFGWATFVINVVGCLLIGVLMVLVEQVWAGRRLLRPFLGVGVLGGFTTFSGYVQDLHHLATVGAARTALVYLAASLAAALVAVWAGAVATGWLIRHLRHRRKAGVARARRTRREARAGELR